MTTDPQIDNATKGKKTQDKDASKSGNAASAHKGSGKDLKQDKKKAENPQTPKPKKSAEEAASANKHSASTAATNSSGKSSQQNSSGKSKYKYGQKRNFYNPPGKVLRHLAQQSYYDNFYGNQGQFYTLKQKYKTQLCKHFLEHGECPLEKYCQFAHGPDELRQANDPLPKNFGKTALGAVHSNYKTIPCKYWEDTGNCKFGDSCSFYHGDTEKRRLIDPLPNLPEGVTLPPMPERVRVHGRHGRHHRNYQGKGHKHNHDQYNQGYFVGGNFQGNNQGVSSFGSQNNFLQLTNLADIAAIGGFNPGKYLTGPPPPQPFSFTAPAEAFEQAASAEKTDSKEATDAKEPETKPTAATVEAN